LRTFLAEARVSVAARQKWRRVNGDRKSEQAKENQVDPIKLKGGTQADYLRARLARDWKSTSKAE
jgi:hypothetical protein